ncbi:MULTISPECIES: SAP domain-containing protein [Methanobrevibacter]|uniref:SAP domain-containing protein n=1 Tax=Methanobrevibacter TaxID=2172 RepID=UPI0015BAE919|nr:MULTISPECIES: SAP domain-containing protein [Methanobrevibacter]MDD6776919.1 SAP domain-containing protein [Methanobacteriaceae archaeon]MDY3097263.1 SAP domain-containing protein [Methanobrevibacter sp.]
MSEQKLEIFNVLNFLDNGYELDDILNEGNFGTFPSAQDCIKHLVDEGYLEGDFEVSGVGNEELTAEEVSKKYTVAQLKDILRENNLKVSGKKQELVERVLTVLNTDDAESDEEISADLDLTDKAKEFLKENEWMDLYMFALVAFRFEDYETYMKNSSEDNVQTALNFCDEIISRALISNQFLVFIDALSAKAHVYAYDKDYESFLEYDLQRFILGLNPIMMDPQTYATYEVINYANVINLKNVVEQVNIGSLKKRFDRIWNKSNIKSTTVPKKACYKILQKAMSGADIEELNFDLRQKYFDKKFGI